MNGHGFSTGALQPRAGRRQPERVAVLARPHSHGHRQRAVRNPGLAG
jgi:hypothetical protein